MKLGIQLETGISYTHHGTFFAKGLILQENRDFFPLIICENIAQVEIYQKMLDFLHIEYSLLEKSHNYTDLLFGRDKIFMVEQNQIKNISLYTLEKKNSLSLKTRQNIDMENLIHKLTEFGYVYNEYELAGSYKRTGDILKIIHFGGKRSYSLSFWGDVLEEIIQEVHISDELKKTSKVETLVLGRNSEVGEIVGNDDIFEILQNREIPVIFESLEFSPLYDKMQKHANILSFDLIENKKVESKNLGIASLSVANVEELKTLAAKGENYFYTKNTTLVKNFIEYNNIPHSHIQEANTSVLKSFQTSKIHVICDDILLKIFTKKRVKRSSNADYDLLLKIFPGDFVVHIDHGVGKYNGIVSKQLPGETGKSIHKEFLEILYAENDKLFVPITEIERVTKYVGVDNPELTSLGGTAWEKKLAKAQRDIEHIAQELLQTFAQRKLEKGYQFRTDHEKIAQFQSKFPYVYTQDQSKAIEEILADMGDEKTMDRILIGDVGFGKTEVAFNAMFNAFVNKKQALLISPLVVLAYEHWEKAKERFADFGVNIGILTRLETEKSVNETLKKLKSGEIDILIGTHRALSEKVSYKNLGLIVIDEEHRFGVEDKEKIKKIRLNIDSLAMSATPIPRSLNMALSGIRDISTLREPPMGRKDIETYVMKFDETLIQEVCSKEFSRGGQVFFIHNRVENIEHMKQTLEKIFPEKKVVYTHGRLSGDELEDRIIDFKHKKYDILLSTTVIENGIDFSNVNTIIINECQNFGLAQLHQLRGRVGRSDKQGYCYLLYKKEVLPEESVKRLKAIVKYSYLGSGFEIALKDLEIRGGGDILGIRQSGHSSIIGVNLYLELLEKKIDELKSEGKTHTSDCKIDLQVEAYIPDNFFNGEQDKLNFYRELEVVESMQEVQDIFKGFQEINPNIDDSVKNLFTLLEIKIYAKQHKITSIKRVGIHYQVEFEKDISVEQLKKFLELDTQTIFFVVSIEKLRCLKQDFSSDEVFLYYLANMFSGKSGKFRKKAK